jgi:hypothetical protein
MKGKVVQGGTDNSLCVIEQEHCGVCLNTRDFCHCEGEEKNHDIFEREIISLTKKLKIAVDALKWFAELNDVFEYPDDWNSFKAGGEPELSDMKRIDVSEVAQNALQKIKSK